MTLVRTLLFRDRLPQHSPSPDEELPLSKWLPETIRARRKASDLSMEKLSAASDLCRMTLHCLETGKNRPTLPTLERLCKGLGITVLGFGNPSLHPRCRTLCVPAMQEYHRLLRDVLDHGNFREDRTGAGAYAVFGGQSRYDLSAATSNSMGRLAGWESC